MILGSIIKHILVINKLFRNKNTIVQYDQGLQPKALIYYFNDLNNNFSQISPNEGDQSMLLQLGEWNQGNITFDQQNAECGIM